MLGAFFEDEAALRKQGEDLPADVHGFAKAALVHMSRHSVPITLLVRYNALRMSRKALSTLMRLLHFSSLCSMRICLASLCALSDAERRKSGRLAPNVPIKSSGSRTRIRFQTRPACHISCPRGALQRVLIHYHLSGVYDQRIG